MSRFARHQPPWALGSIKGLFIKSLVQQTIDKQLLKGPKSFSFYHLLSRKYATITIIHPVDWGTIGAEPADKLPT